MATPANNAEYEHDLSNFATENSRNENTIKWSAEFDSGGSPTGKFTARLILKVEDLTWTISIHNISDKGKVEQYIAKEFGKLINIAFNSTLHAGKDKASPRTAPNAVHENRIQSNRFHPIEDGTMKPPVGQTTEKVAAYVKKTQENAAKTNQNLPRNDDLEKQDEIETRTSLLLAALDTIFEEANLSFQKSAGHGNIWFHDDPTQHVLDRWTKDLIEQKNIATEAYLKESITKNHLKSTEETIAELKELINDYQIQCQLIDTLPEGEEKAETLDSLKKGLENGCQALANLGGSPNADLKFL